MRFLIIIGVLALLLYLLYRYVKKGWDKITLKVYFKSVDLSGISLANIPAILTGGQTVNVVIGADIKNDNTYAVIFSGLKVKLFYKGILIAETSESLSSNKFIVPAMGSLSIQDNAKLILNNTTIDILREKIAGRSIEIGYTTTVRVYGVRIPLISENFTW